MADTNQSASVDRKSAYLDTILTQDRGSMIFEGCDEELGDRKYIRVRGSKEGPGRLDHVLKFLMGEWDLKHPNLLISVTGGAKSFQVKTQQRTAFRRGLIKLARTTDPWIISGGSNTGIMKEVGEAVRDFNLTATSGQSIVAIGIATWGVIQNREHLRTGLENSIKAPIGCENLNLSKSYKIEKNVNSSETFLDPNHTHFILVDDGSVHSFGKEIAFRAEIENAVANLKTDTGKDAVSVPVVLLVVEGGPNTIETVKNAVTKNTPTVVVKGSGKAADIIAYAYEHTTEITETSQEQGRTISRSVSRFDDSVASKIKEMIAFEKWNDVDVENVCKNVEICVRERDLITVFDISATSEMSQGIDIAILKALMKVKRDNSLSQLKLALCWNRIDIANSEIMRYMTRQNLEIALADKEMIMSALNLDRVDFMDLFLDNGVDIHSFLTAISLKRLYQKVSAKSLLTTFLRRSNQKIDIRSDECLMEVGKLISFLLGNFYEVLSVYKKPQENANANPPQQQSSVLKNWVKSQNKHSPKVDSTEVKTAQRDDYGKDSKQSKSSLNHAFQNKVEADHNTTVLSVKTKMKSLVRKAVVMKGTFESIHRLENPYLHLFLWCVLTNRQEMAKLFWKYGKNHIAAALVAHGLLKSMSTTIGEKEAEEKLMQNSDEFSQLAVNILNECQEKDERKATELLTHRSVEWGGTTCEQIAMQTNNKHFVAHATFQALLSSMWTGQLSLLNGLASILLCIVPPFQLLIWKVIRFKEEDQQEQTGNARSPADGGTVITQPDCSPEVIPTTSKIQKIRYFYEAPVVKFVQNFISYVIFLLLFSFALLFQFDTDVTGVEILLYVWVFSLMLEEANQLMSAYTYFGNRWKFMDLLIMVFFIVGVICRFVPDSVTLEVGRIFFSFSFLGFVVRLLGLFSVHKDLGPKLVMIAKMFVDLISFLAILMVFVVGYAIAAHAILYPTSLFDGDIIFHILRIPYWNLYGELILDEMEIKEPDCSFDPLLYENATLPRCPTKIGGYVVPVLMGLYMMIANILLLNLLIAMFSNTFQKIQENADLYWYFQRATLIYHYSRRPVFPPPLILLSHLWSLVLWCYWKCRQVCRCGQICCGICGHRNSSLFGELRDKEASLTQWEKIVADEYLFRTTQTAVDVGSDKAKTTDDTGNSRDRLMDINCRLEQLLAKHEDILNNKAVHKTTQDVMKPVEIVKVKSGKLHVLSRIYFYPSSNVVRFPVSDDMVPWKAKYPDYQPRLVDMQVTDVGQKRKDPDRSFLQENGAILAFNEFDENYGKDRRSVLGKYKIKSGFPLNPTGRTGIAGRGCLPSWGPNHEKRLIVTRWVDDSIRNRIAKKGKPLFQYISWKLSASGDWNIYQEDAMATGTISSVSGVEPNPDIKAKPTQLLESMLQHGQEVYLGYQDSIWNTDNAWMEVTVKTCMDDDKRLQPYCHHSSLVYQDGDTLHVAVWKTASSKDMHDTEHYHCLKAIAKRLRASF